MYESPIVGIFLQLDRCCIQPCLGSTLAREACDARAEAEFGLEIGIRTVLEGELLAVEHADERLDNIAVELRAGDAAQLRDGL